MKIAKTHVGDPNTFYGRYNYQPELTMPLDGRTRDLDQPLVNEIVLWKINRYSPVSSATLEKVKALANTCMGAHRDATDCLDALLGEPGVDLPMASTLLRFRNPNAFQIIDRHAYRAIYGEDYPLYSASGRARKIELYLKYLDDLVDLSRSRGVAFRELDRVLYVFDKELNGKLG